MSTSAPPRYLPLRAAAPASPDHRLSFVRRLPPGAVHKASAAEVFLTDALQVGDDRFEVAAVWHRDRFLHHDGNGRPSDPLLLVETVRQTLIHLSHHFYGIPQGHPFVLIDLEFDLDSGRRPQDSGPGPRRGGPLPVVLDVTCTRTGATPRRFGMALDAVATVDGNRFGRVRMRWEMLHPGLYALVRNRSVRPVAPRPEGALPHRLRRLDPHEVGYAHDDHVLLARDRDGACGEFWLDMKPGHPVLFDHPSDHVSGMALLEAFRQAVLAVGAPLRATVTHLSATFTTFGQLDAPVGITVQPGSNGASASNGADRPNRPLAPRTAQVTAVQGDATLVSAQVGYHLPQDLTHGEVAS